MRQISRSSQANNTDKGFYEQKTTVTESELTLIRVSKRTNAGNIVNA